MSRLKFTFSNRAFCDYYSSSSILSRVLTFFKFTMLELVFALQHDWTEIVELADSLLVFLIRSLQEREKYSALTQAARRLYPLAGTFKLGLNDNGKLTRIKFSEAKAILRDSLGWQSHDQDDLT